MLGSLFSKAKSYTKVILMTTDDNQMPPTVDMKDLADFTLESLEDCRGVMNALNDQLSSDSPFVRVKALRIMKFLCGRGRSDFQLELQRNTEAVRACQGMI